MTTRGTHGWWGSWGWKSNSATCGRKTRIRPKRKGPELGQDGRGRRREKIGGGGKRNLKDALEKAGQTCNKQGRPGRFAGGRLLREYRTEKDTLLREVAYLRRIESWKPTGPSWKTATHAPCAAPPPPFAAGNVPTPDAVDQKIASLDEFIAKTERGGRRKNRNRRKPSPGRSFMTVKNGRPRRHHLKAADNAVIELGAAVSTLAADFDGLKRAVAEKAARVTDIPRPGGDPARGLRARLATWQARVNQQTDIEKQMAGIDEVKQLEAVITRTAGRWLNSRGSWTGSKRSGRRQGGTGPGLW